MKVDGSALLLAATDLSTFSSCRRATLLDREVAYQRLPRPFFPEDPAMQLLRERGEQHEARYRAFLEEKYGEPAFPVPCGVLETLADWRSGTDQTLAAMKKGHRVIFQAPLSNERWHGRADFLERVDHDADTEPSVLGDYHYRAIDTKLAQKPRGSAILQLCIYSEIVTLLQGKAPEYLVVVSPASAPTPSAASPVPKAEEFRTADFGAYFRRIRSRLEAFTAAADLEDVYPEVCEQCDICSWWSQCNERRRADDRLSFVAGISRRDQKLLESVKVPTLTALATFTLPMAERPRKLREETLQRLQRQAKLQHDAIGREPTYELLTPIVDGKGLARLPEPSPGDIFFDIEADRYATDGSFNYLIGWVEMDQSGGFRFHKLWANNRRQERLNFEAFVDSLRRRLEQFPDLHAYHFAPFEKTALGELAGRYATREDDVDDLLRHNVLCDLLPIVKQGLQAGVERYSLKDLEQFYAFQRKTDLREAALARRLFELARESGAAPEVPDVATTIENYNREDCESTKLLRDWLEQRRAELQADGHEVARPIAEEKKESHELTDWLRQVEDLRDRLLKGLPSDEVDRTDGHRARQLLADVLDWHRRKEKPTWWEYFRIQRLTSEECFEESGPIGNLGAERSLGKVDKSQAYEYPFPAQDFKLKVGDQVECPLTKQSVGEVLELRREANAIVVKRAGTLAQPPLALSKVPGGFSAAQMQRALAEIADSLTATGFGLPTTSDEWGPPELTYPAARALLLREPPRLAAGVPLHSVGEAPSDAAVRIAPQLRQTVLAIQGPPGSGKSHTGSHMILELLRQGKHVGITATGHKVIGNLLRKVHAAADKAGIVVRSLQKVTTASQGFTHERNALTTASGNKLKAEVEATHPLDGKAGKLLAGTQYFWSSPTMRQSVDVLIVDEAGQFSLANALAVTVSCDSLVLLGDPQQLAQPDQGSHPPGADASALEHMLNGEATIAPDRGIFLDQTWRLPPSIAAFTSAHFYSGRLKAHPNCARQVIRRTRDAGILADAGIAFERVEHEGSVSFCAEEADRVVELVQEFLREPATWIDRDSNEHPLEPKHILIVAPYNAQVQLINEALEAGSLPSVGVGTVDKFQGQEAPLVIYSMTTSSPEDAPRGIDFLFELERLNVATSRAQAFVIVVASPKLLDAECKMPKQMRLVNGLCGAVEIAQQRSWPLSKIPRHGNK